MDVARYLADGFVVLRGLFDATALAAEVREALADGAPASFRAPVDAGAIAVEYVPMMCERTPTSLALLDALEPVAVRLLGGPVLPTRAKGVRYTGETPWHADTDRRVRSVGFAAYLQPLTADTGALRLVPGSHRGAAGPGVAVPTQPGDVIAFDEHVLHASTGGATRLQWRADYLRDPAGDEAAEVRAYFADTFPPDEAPPYDAARFPSYGPAWRSSARRAVARLGALGVYDLARGR